MLINRKTKVNKMDEKWPDEPVKVSDDDMNDFVEKYPLAVIDFWAAWCGPCRMVAPVLKQLAKEMQGKVTFGKLNVDENRRTSGAFGISSIPTMVIFKDGKEVDRIMGALPKEALKKELAKHI